MSQVRRRRALRSSVLAASLAVLASLVVAPPAVADDTTATTTAATPTGNTAPSDAAPATGTTSTPTASDPAPPVQGSADGGSETSPPEVPADAPVADSAADVDSGDTVVGELVQAFVDPAGHLAEGQDHHEHDHESDEESPLSWIRTDDGSTVQVVTDDVPDVAPGSTLAVTVGDEQAPARADEVEDGAREVLAATVLDAADTTPTVASAGGAPTNVVTAVLVVPSGGSPSGATINQVVDELNGEVSSFWDEQSNGTIRISAVAGSQNWVYSSATCTGNGYAALMNDVARQVNWSPGAGKHLMAYIPDWRRLCGGAYGMGEVKARPTSGGTSWVGGVALDVMAHELGHNFGLGHSSKYQCDNMVDTGSCQTVDYADFYDVMGYSWGQVGSLNAVQALRLGALPASEQVSLTTASSSTTVDLAPVSATSGTRAIKLTATGGTVYLLEYRQASGRDAWLADSSYQNRAVSGVVLRRVSSGNNTSLLLDGTPSPSSAWSSDTQQVLPVGSAVRVADQSFLVTVRGTGSTATVDVGPVVTADGGDPYCTSRSGTTNQGVALAGSPTASRAFGVGLDRALWTRTDAAGWESLGGWVSFAPTAVTAASGETTVLVAGSDGSLFTRDLVAGTWGPWVGLGGVATASPAVVATTTGLQAFVRGTDGTLWTRARGADRSWGPWVNLGGYLTSSPTATISGAQTTVTVRGTDGRIWSRSLSSSGVATAWSGGAFAVCAPLAMPAQQVAGGARSAFTDSRSGAWVVASSGEVTTLGGFVTSAMAISAAPGSYRLAGRGLDGALWVYTSGTGWRSWGGGLL